MEARLVAASNLHESAACGSGQICCEKIHFCAGNVTTLPAQLATDAQRLPEFDVRLAA